MSDSRERFEEWFEANAKYIEPSDWFQWLDAAWQDAEAQAVRRCVEWIDAFSIAGDRSEHMKHGIQGTFPDAFEQANSTEPKTSL